MNRILIIAGARQTGKTQCLLENLHSAHKQGHRIGSLNNNQNYCKEINDRYIRDYGMSLTNHTPPRNISDEGMKKFLENGKMGESVWFHSAPLPERAVERAVEFLRLEANNNKRLFIEVTVGSVGRDRLRSLEEQFPVKVVWTDSVSHDVGDHRQCQTGRVSRKTTDFVDPTIKD